MELKVAQFCGLSRSQKWRSWLGTIAPDLLKSLENISRYGCKANKEKMVEIKSELYNRGHGKSFETFIETVYPQLIKQSKSVRSDKPKERHVSARDIANNIYNKHRVFKSYKPGILTFPHKHIICGPSSSLDKKARLFVRNKIGWDYVIIEDRCYIEYFDRKYASEVSKFPKSKREIYVYREKMKRESISNTKQ